MKNSIKMDDKIFNAVDVSLSNDDSEVLCAVKNPAVLAVDEPTYAKLVDSHFHNGIIEIKVLSKLLDTAPEYARGFIGVAFRIAEDDSAFELIYIRPTNGRCENQLRRNRSVQYISYPDYKFDRLRKENPCEYESYADIGLNEWIDLKIEVKDRQAKLFLNTQSEPALIVNDLKHGGDAHGQLGLWVDIGTKGYFKDLKITSY